MNWISIGSVNSLSPVRSQAITWTNTALLSIRPLGTNFNEIQMEIQNFTSMKMHLKMLSAKVEAILSRKRRVKSHGPIERHGDNPGWCIDLFLHIWSYSFNLNMNGVFSVKILLTFFRWGKSDRRGVLWVVDRYGKGHTEKIFIDISWNHAVFNQ